MVIHAMDFEDSRELFSRLKETLQSRYGTCVRLTVVVPSAEFARRVEAFAKMSGHTVAVEQKNGAYEVSITGVSCGCG